MNRSKQKRMGRPPLKQQQRRSAIVTVRMTKKERNKLEQKAREAGLSLSGYILKCLREEGT